MVNVVKMVRNLDSMTDNSLLYVSCVEVTCRGQRLLLLLTSALVRDLPRYGTGQVLFLSLGEDRGRSAGHDGSGDGMPAPVPVPQVLEEADLVKRLGHVMYSDDS